MLLNIFADEVIAEFLYLRFPDGAIVRVAAVHWRPHIIVTADAEDHRTVTGPMGNVLTILAHTLNFT